MSRAVITGIGAVSAFGLGRAALFDGLRGGETAVRSISSFDASTFAVQVAGEVPVASFSPAQLAGALESFGVNAWTPPPSAAFADRKIPCALWAAAEAWRDANCGAAEQKAWTSIGLGLEQALLSDFGPFADPQRIDWDAVESSVESGTMRFRTRVDLAHELVRDALKIHGPMISNVSACAAGALAIAQGAALIERGQTEIVLAGAADSMVNPMGLGGMARLGAPSPRAAADACRPFDARRDGLVIGEGSAMFVLESETRARDRGQTSYARVLGWGRSQDGYRVTAPRPDGSAAAAAMTQALQRAALAPEALGYVNAHGTGTPLNDPAEANALHLALGSCAAAVPVSSIKGAVGHLMAAAGAIELAASLLAFTDDQLPGTANHAHPAPDCPLQVIGPKPLSRRVDTLMSNSFGFGGQNAAVILGRVS